MMLRKLALAALAATGVGSVYSTPADAHGFRRAGGGYGGVVVAAPVVGFGGVGYGAGFGGVGYGVGAVGVPVYSVGVVPTVGVVTTVPTFGVGVVGAPVYGVGGVGGVGGGGYGGGWGGYGGGLGGYGGFGGPRVMPYGGGFGLWP